MRWIDAYRWVTATVKGDRSQSLWRNDFNNWFNNNLSWKTIWRCNIQLNNENGWKCLGQQSTNTRLCRQDLLVFCANYCLSGHYRLDHLVLHRLHPRWRRFDKKHALHKQISICIWFWNFNLSHSVSLCTWPRHANGCHGRYRLGCIPWNLNKRCRYPRKNYENKYYCIWQNWHIDNGQALSKRCHKLPWKI